MGRYILTIPARTDLKEISRYIARDNSDAARRLKEKIKQKCRTLADFPEMGQICDRIAPSLRSFTVESYLIFYRPIAGGIEVIRVVSGYRNIEALFSDIDE